MRVFQGTPAICALLIAAGCSGQNANPAIPQTSGPAIATTAQSRAPGLNAAPLSSFSAAQVRAAHGASGRVRHVVIIFQENRTPDNLFRGLPGADTTPPLPLAPDNLRGGQDRDHSHSGFLRDMSHWDSTSLRYVPQDQVRPYWDLAERYTFGDRMFQTNEGPSFPAHQYIVSGTSTIAPGSPYWAAENPMHARGGGCDSPAGALVALIDQSGNESQAAYPCFDRPTLTDLIDAKALTWHYYQARMGPGLWNGLDAIKHVRNSFEYAANVTAPPSQIFRDIRQGRLANVVWLTPTAAASDHAHITNGSGPSWVARVVDAIGRSRYWNDTAILITWDDWGGWYDHVAPPQYNAYELGFRVPLIVVSPYAKRGYVSHQQHEFGSLLKFTEEAFGLGSLGTTDVRADDLSDCFDYSHGPAPFEPVAAPLSEGYFLTQNDGGAPDD